MSTPTSYGSDNNRMPLGPQALILSKHYYGALSKSLDKLDIDRYYSVVFYLNTNNGCTQQEICNSLAIDKTAMVKVMNYLVKAGYVKRNVNPDDRREHFVSLTAKGKKQTAVVVRAFEAIEEEAFRGITKAEKDLFRKVMGKLNRALKDMPANDLFFNYKKTGATKADVPGRQKRK